VLEKVRSCAKEIVGRTNSRICDSGNFCYYILNMPFFSSVRSFLALTATLAAALGLSGCSSSKKKVSDVNAVVSVRDQKMGIYNKDGKLTRRYNISTSKFGLGDRPGSNCTPLGKHEVVAKIGHGLPSGAVLKGRHWSGEVVKPNAPGRDPIVSRILWLNGLESRNRNAYGRCIYIHGTAEEKRLGSPASYGCVRMAAKDVIKLFNELPVGATVSIVTDRLPRSNGVPETQPVPTPLPAVQPLPIDVTQQTQMSNVASAPVQRGAPVVQTPYISPATAATASTATPNYAAPAAPAGPSATPLTSESDYLPSGPGVVLKTRGYSPSQSFSGSTASASSRYVGRSQ
jgi:hypothetical protein